MNVLVAEPHGYSPRALDIYRQVGPVTLAVPERGWILRNLAETEVLVVRLQLVVDADLLRAGPRLAVVASPTTGLNHIDISACDERGIEVISLRGETAFLESITATAQHAFGLVIALVRGTVRAHQHVLAGGWDRDLFRGRDLDRLTLGILGYGRVGRQMAGYARVFGMQVLAHDRNDKADPEIRMVTLDELLMSSDVISLHASWSPESHELLGAREFGLMRRGCLLINTARGELVDQEALAASIESGHVAGAALDVLADEYASDGPSRSPLVELARRGKNVLITPHLGGCTVDSMEATEIFTANKVKAHCDARRVSS